jgi:four helix bundle protein
MSEAPPDLKVRTLEFARRIIRLYSSLPRDTVAHVFGKHLLRSGTSIGAKSREATPAATPPLPTATSSPQSM